MEEKHETIVLVDEEGEEEEFVCLETVEMNDSKYVVLLPVGPEDEPDEDEEYEEDEDDEDDEDDEEDEDEVIILKVVENDEEESFSIIENEEELDMVYDAFLSGYGEEEEL